MFKSVLGINRIGTRSYATSKFGTVKTGALLAFNSVIVVGSVGLTGLAIYAIGKELFSSSGDTKLFNRSIKLIEHNLYCQKMLQCEYGSEKLSALGNGWSTGKSTGGWGRGMGTPVASSRRLDNLNNEHVHMMYEVFSLNKKGTVQLEAIRHHDSSKTELRSLALNVDKEVFYVIAPPKISPMGTSSNGGFLGVHWGTKT